MNIRDAKKEDLEAMSYLDIAYGLLKQDKTKKTTVELLKEICSLLELDNDYYQNLVGDFYTSLTVDKRFLLIESGKWDLKENHSVKIIVDDELDDLDGIDELEDIDEEYDEEKEDFMLDDEENEDTAADIDDIDDTDLDVIDELDDLTVLDDDELEQTDD